MKLEVTLDENGLIPDKYAKFAPAEFRTNDMPTVNFPVKVTDIPAGTKSLTVSIIDYDAVPVGGFPWIHWLVANLPVGDIPEDLSNSDVPAVFGTNSMWNEVKDNPEITQTYIGPMPPDKQHDYTLTVFALDTELDVAPGFFLNELRSKSNGHVLDMAIVELPARSE